MSWVDRVPPALAVSYTFTTIDYPGVTGSTIASGINDAGYIVGSYGDSAGGHGYLLSSGGGFSSLDVGARRLPGFRYQ